MQNARVLLQPAVVFHQILIQKFSLSEIASEDPLPHYCLLGPMDMILHQLTDEKD